MKCLVILGCAAGLVLVGALVSPPESGRQGILVGAGLLILNLAAVIGIRPTSQR